MIQQMLVVVVNQSENLVLVSVVLGELFASLHKYSSFFFPIRMYGMRFNDILRYVTRLHCIATVFLFRFIASMIET